jgi:hypothetical protein
MRGRMSGMDEPRPPLIKLICLIAFMCLGALFGIAILGEWFLEVTAGYDHGQGESARCNLVGAVLGALGGVCLELALRLFEKPLPQVEKPKLQFSLRTLLVATTLTAAMLGLVVAVLRWPAG